VLEGAEEVAAVAEQDTDGAEDEGDAFGHGGAGAIRWIGRRGWSGYRGFHLRQYK
jgi:hypothetical protein